tara:strand:+ start:340 stop:996 length:657 start_codon:yes stop_codon:yes gene_type:complete
MIKNKKFKLNIEENYLKDLLYDKNNILKQYFLIIQHYIEHCLDNTNNKNNSIFYTGLNMTTNIFRLMLFYTRNLELTMYHTRNGIYYYVEYISQITDTDDNIFFNLTVKDAIMYVYTRTLFDINKSYSKDSSNTTIELDFLNDYLIFMNTLSSLLIKDYSVYKVKLKSVIDLLKSNIDEDTTLTILDNSIHNFKMNIKNHNYDDDNVISYFQDKKTSY